MRGFYQEMGRLIGDSWFSSSSFSLSSCWPMLSANHRRSLVLWEQRKVFFKTILGCRSGSHSSQPSVSSCCSGQVAEWPGSALLGRNKEKQGFGGRRGLVPLAVQRISISLCPKVCQFKEGFLIPHSIFRMRFVRMQYHSDGALGI